MAKKTKEEILAEMIRDKRAAGLSPEQAKECAERQLAHDEALEAAAEESDGDDDKRKARGKLKGDPEAPKSNAPAQ